MKKILIALVTLFNMHLANAQDDLMKILEKEQAPSNEKVLATFKTTKLVNTQTNETVHKRVLDFRIGHRFGSIGNNYGGGFHNWYGLYSINDIRFAFEYGITEKLSVGISRCKSFENFEGLIKYRILQQTSDDKIPIAITVFGNTAISGVEDNSENNVYSKFTRRINYSTELIIARKFSNSFSFTINPTYIHRNYVSSDNDKNDLFALGAGFRFKVAKSLTIIGDYFYNFDNYIRNNQVTYANNKPENYWDPIGIGMEIETGGHIFSIFFSNSPYLLETDLLTHASENPLKGGIKLGFNISRNFRL